MSKKDAVFYCPICGEPMAWDSSSTRPDDDDSIVDFYHCMRCGGAIEFYWPNEEEKQDYHDYWDKFK